MRTNTNITIYNRYTDTATKTALWQRTVLTGALSVPVLPYAALWQSSKAVNAQKVGSVSADNATIYIPIALDSNYVDAVQWDLLPSKVGKWTLHPESEDLIVKGEVLVNIAPGLTVTQLKKLYSNVFTITSVDIMDHGPRHLNHWQIGAK